MSIEAAAGVAPPHEDTIMTTDRHRSIDDDQADAGDDRTRHSPTAWLLDELALHGARPGSDETDHRPLPEADRCAAALAEIVDLFGHIFEDTRLEDDLAPVLWAFVNLFHGQVQRIERDLDRNEDAQRRGQREQDGSEIRAVELERLIAEGLTLIEQRNAFEFMREHAAALFEVRTGSTWRPRTGSRLDHRTLTAAMIDSRDFIEARRRADTTLLIPAGPRVAFTGGMDYQDTDRICGMLDRVRTRHPDMVLLHGGASRGAELIAAKWAEARGVPQVVFKPDWARHRKAAPFKRNDALLEAMPIGLVAFPGSGISDNLVDKARARGIPVFHGDRRG